MTVLNTERLTLRPLKPADAAAMFVYRSDPKVAMFQTWEPQTLAQVEEFIADLSETSAFALGVWSQLGIILNGSATLVGDVGIHVISTTESEFGITLNPVFWGRGIAREALTIVLLTLFRDLGITRVTASVDPRNARSIALMRRMGLTLERTASKSLLLKGEWVDDMLFATSRDAYFALFGAC